MIKVALDAMGGDNAPGEIVKGAVDAVITSKNSFVLVFVNNNFVINQITNYN